MKADFEECPACGALLYCHGCGEPIENIIKQSSLSRELTKLALEVTAKNAQIAAKDAEIAALLKFNRELWEANL
jgi:hypothetical protein